MLHPRRSTLRLLVGPGVVAGFAGFELWPTGMFAAFAGVWFVFAICIFALSAWDKIQFKRSRRRLESRRARRSSRTR